MVATVHDIGKWQRFTTYKHDTGPQHRQTGSYVEVFNEWLLYKWRVLNQGKQIFNNKASAYALRYVL